MTNHTEFGHAASALYTLQQRAFAAAELGAPDPDEIRAPYVLGIWNETGDGIALQGDRTQLLQFAELLKAFIARETSALPALTHALADLHALQQRRNAELDAGWNVSRIEEDEVHLLYDVAAAAEDIAEQL